MTGRVKCISNSSNNGNFTLNKEYEVKYYVGAKKPFITCDFIKLDLDKEPITNIFKFAFCEFEFISR